MNKIKEMACKNKHLKFVMSVYVCDHVTTKRTWTERLFSLPWKPFDVNKTEYKPALYALDDNCFIVSWQTYSILLEEGLIPCDI